MAPMEVTLAFSAPPLLFQSVELVATVKPLIAAPATEVRFTLPEGIERVEGELIWQGDLAQGQEKSIPLKVRAVMTGTWTVTVDAVSHGSDETAFGKAATLYVSVGPIEAAVSQDAPADLAVPLESTPERRYEEQSPTPKGLSSPSPKTRPYQLEPAVPDVQSPTGSIVVYGYWEYRDKAGTDHPVREALVEIWDEDDIGGDDLLASTYTDSTGYYQATVPNNDIVGGQDIYVRIYSTDNHAVSVEDFSGNQYDPVTPTTNDVPDGNFYVGDYVITDATNRMVWYIYDKIGVDAWHYLYDQVGWDNNYLVVVRWTPTSTDGTHYHPGSTIDLLAGDRWDEDVFLHEYGHFVMDKTYATYPPTPNCNPHSWGTHSSIGCAWSEGWANFLQAAIQGHQDYVDTEDQTLHHYYEAPTPAADHPEDEGAITASLWDIFDTADETWDTLDDGFNGTANDGIWDVLYNDDPNTVQDFWSDWGASSNGHCSQLWSILDHHVIDYDTGAPTNPSSVTSSSHTASTWSSDNTVVMSWSGAADGCGSGVNGYSRSWTTSATTLPDTTVDTTGNSYTSPALSDGNSWYFHIRTRDNAGNWNSGAVHRGPYWIDTTAPTNPASATETHGVVNNVWQNSVGTPSFTWSGASDGSGSGIDRYYIYWGTNASGTSTFSTTTTSYAASAVASPSVYYLRVQTRDKVGNTNAWQTLFTFRYDATPPTSPITVTSTSHMTGTWSTDNTIAMSWSGATDGSGSGLAGYSFSWTTSPTSIPDTITETTGSNNTSAPLSDNGNWYFHIRTRDNAGNWSSSTIHRGPYRVDATAPNCTMTTLPVTTTAASFDLAWSATDPGNGSGVGSYDIQYRIAGTGVWTNWLQAVTSTTSLFGPSAPIVVKTGETYYFRCRARDLAGNLEAYPGGNGDAWTTAMFYSVFLPLVLR